MWLKWLPWKFIVRRMARSKGFLDPIALLSYVRRFSQPSEVHEPIELLRAGVVLHARGLMNSRSIQQNLDWVWPMWVERQFNPHDVAFVPRAFSLTHINLTHRNWTAVGIPDYEAYPLVDPHGLVIPHYDGWSLDAWIVTREGRLIAPSKLPAVEQELNYEPNLAVVTRAEEDGFQIHSRVEMTLVDGQPVCRIVVAGRAPCDAWLVISARPYNPEGIDFIHEIELTGNRQGWLIDGKDEVRFSAPADLHSFSEYHAGDVSMHLTRPRDARRVVCNVGMATAAVLFQLAPETPRAITCDVPVRPENAPPLPPPPSAEQAWADSLAHACRLRHPDPQIQFLWDVHLRTLVQHAPGDVYPGPYTYKRFWFRDAAFMLHALACVGLDQRVERVLDRFPERQTPFGYFLSQEGEWDSNGEALWIMQRYCALTGRPPKRGWRTAIERGAHWIDRKRSREGESDPVHQGLFPPGFSAEHLGPNDYYYWDDFWGVAGLMAAAELMLAYGDEPQARQFERYALQFMQAIEHSLRLAAERLGRPAMPAAPDRRLDPGMIGCLVVGYPLQLWRGDDHRLLDTLDYLMSQCRVHGGFFQDMIHSGINPYLTLHMAQVLLRAGDGRFLELMKAVARLASPTGQWPEAIHPHTRGGCMGDGQHIWAAAEWIMLVRNCFLYEEPALNRLVLGAGIASEWLLAGEPLTFGPAPTPWGPVSIRVEPTDERVVVRWQARWRAEPPEIEVRLPEAPPLIAGAGVDHVELARNLAPTLS